MQPLPEIETLASQVPAAIERQLREMGHVIAPATTAALYAGLQEAEPYEGVQVLRDQRCGPDPRHRLDIFAPAGTAPAGGRAVLAFVHGGGFTGGSRRAEGSPFYDNIMLWAARQGMVGVNMTYRLAPAHPWPAAQQDLGAAVGWVHENITRFGGDPERLALVGHSAGAAHVAQYLAHPQFHARPGGGVRCAVLLSGMFDPANAQQTPTMQSYFGPDAQLQAQRSALPGLAASAVPLLVAFAGLDPANFREQAERAQAALARAGRTCRVAEALGHSHLSEVYAFNTGDRALSDLVLRFVKQACRNR